MSRTSATAGAAAAIHHAFDAYHQGFRDITRRVGRRFEDRDWSGIRRDTVERADLHPLVIGETLEEVRRRVGPQLTDRAVWSGLKAAYTREILGRDDFELAQTFFNSLSRQVFSHTGVDPAIDYVADDFPLPYKGWEMASARMYALARVDAAAVRRILLDAGFGAPFRDLDGDARLAAERIAAAAERHFQGSRVEAIDVLRPVFYRNRGAYVIGRARRGGQVMPLILALLHGDDGIEVDAVLYSEDEASIVFSFARWYFHVEVDSPREVIGFLRSILPRKRLPELYISIGHTRHGKTEFYRDLMGHIAVSDDRFVVARGQRGMVMAVFTLPSYEFVFKVIKDRFDPPKTVTRHDVMRQYRWVLSHDRVGRMVDFQEFEHLTFPRDRFAPELLDELLEVAAATVHLDGADVVVDHVYVQRKVEPLDLYVRPGGEAARWAAVDLGHTLKDMAAANIFPGDVLLKNFGATRHGRVVFYDYDEICPLTECNFRRLPRARDPLEEMAAEPWFSVGDDDVFPEQIRTFMGLGPELQEVFAEAHGDLFGTGFWREMQERNRRGEIIGFFPYPEERRLRAGRPRAIGGR